MKSNLLVFCSFFLLMSATTQATVEHKVVSVISPEHMDISQKIMLAGTVESLQNARLAVLEPGVIADLIVDIGDRVKKGQILLQLDDRLAQLKLEELAAFKQAKITALAEAKRLHNEVLALSTKQLVAQTLIEERKAAIELADAAVKQAKSQYQYQKELLARHQLKAPFDGVIAKREVDVGEWVTPQVAVFTLVNQNQLRVKLEIPQEYYSLLTNNQAPVKIIPNAKNIQPLEGSINRLVAIANEQSRTFTAYVNLDVTSPLIAGMSVNASVTLPKTDQNVIWLPKSAVKQHPDGGMSVFAVVNNKAKRFLVKVIEQSLEQVAITGVPQNLPIISTGVAILRDGEIVQVGKE